MENGVAQCVERSAEIKLTWEDMLTLCIYQIILDIVAIIVASL